MKISKIKESARLALKGKWGKGACITLAYLAFDFLVGFIIGLLGEESFAGELIDLVNSIIQVPIMLGLGYAFIKLKRNEDVKAFDFLSLGFSNFGRAWKISLTEFLQMFLPIILMIVSATLLAFTLAIGDSGAGNNIEPLIGLAGTALLIVSLIWWTVRGLLYSLTTYVAYDNPNMTSLEVVKESERMMKGNRVKIFLLSLSFIGWGILSVITLGIGSLWLLPYTMVAEICFYEHLLGKKETENTESTENDESNVDAITEM